LSAVGSFPIFSIPNLHASKNVDNGPGASYNITSEGSLALVTNLMTMRGAYTLAVDFESNTTSSSM
jgi:hypothetical protein